MRRLFALVLILTVALAACSDGSDGNNSNNDSEDAGGDAVEDVLEDTKDDTGEDAGDTDQPDTDDAGDTQEDADTCTPRTECGPDECGTVDDGCGGTLDCGIPCNCIDGESQGVSCGECGVGTYQCAPGETGEGTCASPDLPGLDDASTDAECEDALIYVDGSLSMIGEGTKASPYRRYRDATEAAEPGDIVLLANAEEYSTLIIEDGVSTIGGFDGETWAFDPTRPTVVNRQTVSTSDHQYAVFARDITQQTVLAHLDLQTEDGSINDSTYGLVAIDADDLELRHLNIAPGRAGDGDDGNSGFDGRDGGVGARSSRTFVEVRPPGGDNTQCPSANGGDGGEGALYTDPFTGQPTAGLPAASGASGGAAGMDGTNTDKAGKDGEDGEAVPTTAADGSGGVFVKSIQDDLWLPGGAGEDGEAGEDGHGGGGGGGSWHGPQYCTATNGDPVYYQGIKGSGGGAGGCGGGGGEGGDAGGGSFGLFLVRSTVRVADSSIAAGDAGNGGPGGAGGFAGLGGSGGDRGTGGPVDGTLCDPTQQSGSIDFAFNGGAGGDGSDGANGGAGGGGAGGASYGVFCEDSTPTVDANTTVSAGTAGTGGAGPGNPGEDGEAADFEGCP
jgi:hypothetical protein